MRRIISLLTLSTLALAACGGSDAATETTSPPAGSATAGSSAPAEANTPAETDAPADAVTPTDTAAPAETAAGTDTASGAVAVTLVEWAIDTPVEVSAGLVTFDVSNDGSFPHHFAIARGDSYEELPMVGDGAVDEAALGDDYLGRTANLQGGQTETIAFDLEPGNYVFFCNIAGSVSHAAKGQVLSVTVG